MKFIDFDKDEILANSIKCDNGYYEYTIGNPLEVTSVKSNHHNSVISKNLSSDLKDDKLMVKYKPTNKIYFSPSFIHSESDDFFASCHLDAENGCIYVGTPSEFGVKSGVLVFSGFLSLNNYVESDRPILCNSRLYSTIKDRVRVLSIGVRGDKLYGLVFVPSTKGLAISVRDSKFYGVSPTTYRRVKCEDYKAYTIKDWFDGNKVKEV